MGNKFVDKCRHENIMKYVEIINTNINNDMIPYTAKKFIDKCPPTYSDIILAGSLVFLASKKVKHPISSKEIAKIINQIKNGESSTKCISSYYIPILKAYKKIIHSYNMKLCPVEQVSMVSTQCTTITQPEVFIEGLTNKLKSSKICKKYAFRIFRIIHKKKVMSNTTPLVLAAVCVYLATLITGNAITKKTVADAANIRPITISKNYKILDSVDLNGKIIPK